MMDDQGLIPSGEDGAVYGAGESEEEGGGLRRHLPGTFAVGIRSFLHRGGTPVAPESVLLQTEVEVLMFAGGERASEVRRHRPAQRMEISLTVGGLVYGFERGRWIFRGIREAYLVSNREQGRSGIGQVLAISDSDSKVIQRNLHASLGRRTFLISGVCAGAIARKLRQYLKAELGGMGFRPIHPLDLAKHLDTRGWVVRRNVYHSQPLPALAVRTPTPRPPLALSSGPPPSGPEPSPVRPEPSIPASGAAPALAAPPTMGSGTVPSARPPPVREIGRGHAVLRGVAQAFRGRGREPAPGGEPAPLAPRPVALAPTGSRKLASSRAAARTLAKAERRITVMMQLRPPSRPSGGKPAPRGNPGTRRRVDPKG